MARTAVDERCGICGAPIADDHPHVADIVAGALQCACPNCHVLFERPGAAAGRLRSVPCRYVPLAPEVPKAWDLLEVPVGLAFAMVRSPFARATAFYPGPAGVTESALPLPAWQLVVDADAVLATLADDVEAVLVGDGEAWLVPVDACYALAGAVRSSWSGLDGGDEVRHAIDRFFAGLRARASSRRG